MEGRIILRSSIGDELMVLPIEKKFKNIPRIGERLELGDIYGPCATVTMVTHFHNGFYYPGEVMRREGYECRFGINCSFSTMVDVDLDEDFYDPHTAETWHGQMGWDIVSQLKGLPFWISDDQRRIAPNAGEAG